MNPFPNSDLLQTFTQYRCRDCGSEEGFRSRRRTITERYILPVFLLQPVRCGECFRRDYRNVFTKVRERLSETGTLTQVKLPVRDTRNVA
ncbi:MAG TPA: hypothetical protein VFO39_05400 [Candidatus Sulfotelmatobacter sp.]|nr:hypothetical protein [Candidatus Sulfotelmatobacter sp.]